MYKDKEKQKAFQRQWQREQRKKRRSLVIKMLGGKCCRCGYMENNAALQIDHIEPILRGSKETKSSYSCQQLVNRIARGLEGIENLQLLCANCHSIKTYEEDRLKFNKFNKEVFKPKK